MGREIRRVPKDWEHPRDDKGHYRRCFDEDYKTRAERWCKEFEQFRRGEHESQKGEHSTSCAYLWEWDGGPPDEEYCRPAFKSEPVCYQIYETVSEGTPTSPVFESKEGMVRWLVGEGHSQAAAEAFSDGGWAPSMMLQTGPGGSTLKSNIHALEPSS